MKKTLYPVPTDFLKHALMDESEYKRMYAASLENPAAFWGEQAKQFIDWFSPWQKVLDGNFDSGDIKWFTHGKLNASYNCLDRHLEKNGKKTALIWQGDNPDDVRKITYESLHQQVSQFANVLKQLRIKKGDRVCIYLPMIPEAVVVMLACARIGAIHSIVFSAFSPDSLKKRLQDANCSLLVTADEGVRGGKINTLKKNADMALAACPFVNDVIVIKRTGGNIAWEEYRDHWYHEVMSHASTDCPPESMDADDPLFILYTSGSTGNPKGVLHITGGYLVYVAASFKYIFNYQDEDVFWCTADIGWITGHSYLVYGPLLNGATTLLFEGVPHYPDYSRYWEIIETHHVTQFYTAPTAIRALRKEGDSWVKKYSRKSLKLLGSVGEPINPDVWRWYFEIVGEKRCPIVDTWWQTETGGILLSPLPGATPLKPGSVAQPFFGIEPAIVDSQGNSVPPSETGHLVIKKPWPGMMKTIYGDHQRFIDSYLKEIPGAYLSGDGARYDQDGYIWIIGRDDDVIKVSGHRIGTGELENVLLTHHNVFEAAVVSIPHEIKGNSIYAFVTVPQAARSEKLKQELLQIIKNTIGSFAVPDFIQWVDDLPKTRSGKIMRRILRKIANLESDNLGDISTLANPEVIEKLVKDRQVLKE